MEAFKDETALEVAKPKALERLTVNQIEDAFKEYLELQKRLDKLMPDQIMTIKKQKFRKKGYWRMVKKWARLGVEIVKEERIETGDDWGYLVTARVTTPDGQSEDGDGSCMASEKNVYKKDWDAWKRNGKQGPPPPIKDKDGRPIIDEVETAKNATVHNVRAHATTRAKNRAISDLVGFGEVSAEELPPGDGDVPRNEEQGKPRNNPQQKADEQAKNPPPRNNHTPDGVFSTYKGADDPTVFIPAEFKVKPKSGKSLIYIIDGKDFVFPIGQVKSYVNGCVEVTEWIADKKIENDGLPPEIIRDSAFPQSDADEPPPIDDDDVPF
jgi:hypothetical protein